ncbi:hypothetical protein QLX08_000950 [Tetragonisca angustula]|uniref:Uncharacterized protein n=1 Tax=Tetragonisca angustula TaxID=166442 RepID=A0AAW1AHB0_9HYME
MTFVKSPTPCPIPRMNPERKPSAAEACHATDGTQLKSFRTESPKWEPLRKFAPAASKSAESSPKQDKSEPNRDTPTTSHSPDANEQSKRLTQRMRDLYDFKTENEWPKRATNVRRGNTWISKSSSEEERTCQPVRRNSQDLEFNDRMNVIKLKDTKVQSDHQESPKRPRTARKEEPARSSVVDVFNSEYEERLRKFNERLRYSEDLGSTRPKMKERRTYSDDYDEKSRRGSTRSARTECSTRTTRTDSIRLSRAEGSIRSTRSTRSEDLPGSRSQAEKKRPSDVGSARSRGSYAEVTPTKKRDSRTSDASYASVANYSKRASVDCKSTKKMVDLPPRRAFSQEKPSEERPSAPVPPIEWNDDRYAAARLKEIAERQKRDSTRYKVYLT